MKTLNFTGYGPTLLIFLCPDAKAQWSFRYLVSVSRSYINDH